MRQAADLRRESPIKQNVRTEVKAPSIHALLSRRQTEHVLPESDSRCRKKASRESRHRYKFLEVVHTPRCADHRRNVGRCLLGVAFKQIDNERKILNLFAIDDRGSFTAYV